MQTPTNCNHNPKGTLAKGALIAAVVYAVGVFAVMGTALLSGGATVIGHPESDVWKHLWGVWWMSEELQRGIFPTWTDLQHFPAGGKLYIIDPLNAMTASFFKPLVGLVQAYNFTLALQLFAASFSAWLLARWLTKSNSAALVAGAAYGFCPFMLTSGISSGIAETSNLAWLPLAALGLLLGFDGHHKVLAVVLGAVGLALSAFGSWYYGMAAMLFGIMLGIWTASVGTAPYANAKSPQWAYPLLACLISGILMFPLALMFASSLKGEGSLLAQIEITNRQKSSTLEFIHQRGNYKNNADLKGFIAPGKDKISTADDVDRRLKSVYVGLFVLLLAAIGVAKGEKWTRFWLFAGIAAILLAIGPFFCVTPNLSFSKPWNLFYMLAYNVVPGFRMVAISDRLSIVAQLCVSVLAAAGLQQLLHQRRAQTLLAIGATAVIFAEIIWVSPVPWPIPTAASEIPQASRFLATTTEHAGLIQLPLNREQNTLQPGEYFYWQTQHRKPMPIALTTRFPVEMLNNALVGTLYLCEEAQYGKPPKAAYIASGLKELQQNGFRWIQVNTKMYRPESAKKVATILTQMLGQPRRGGDGSLLYTIPPLTATKDNSVPKA